eukprot:s3300_g5.t1
MHAHIYTDGSYLHAHDLNAYAGAVIIQHGEQQALFGGVGGPIRGAVCPILGQALRIFPVIAATAHFDCQAAGWGADGSWRSTTLPKSSTNSSCMSGASLRTTWTSATSLLVSATLGTNLSTVLLSWQLNGILVYHPPAENCQSFLCSDLSWLAAAAHGQRHQALPIQLGQWLSWAPGERYNAQPITAAELIPTITVGQGGSDLPAFEFSTMALSVNMQGMSGKRKYVEDQLLHKECRICFLQETKAQEGSFHIGSFLRFASQSKQNWGVAVLLNRQRGIFDVDGHAVHVEDADVNVLHSDERLIVLKIQKSAWSCVLLSGHYPHAGRMPERRNFLRRLTCLLKGLHASIIIDGRPPADYDYVTGGLQFGEVDEAGRQAAETLQTTGLWLPATFEALHTGPSATFQHVNGQEHRLDFIAIGGTASILDLHSQVADDFDTATTKLRTTVPSKCSSKAISANAQPTRGWLGRGTTAARCALQQAKRSSAGK